MEVYPNKDYRSFTGGVLGWMCYLLDLVRLETGDQAQQVILVSVYYPLKVLGYLNDDKIMGDLDNEACY